VSLLFAAVGGLLAVPTLAANFGIAAAPTLASLALGLAACLLLWHNQSRAAHPIVDTILLRQRSFTLPALIYLLFLLCHAGAAYSLAFVVADRPGGNAKEVGLLMFFIYAASAVVAPFAGRLTDRFDPRRVLYFATSGMMVVFALYAQIRVETPLWQVVAIGVMLGLLVGAKTPAIMKIALGTISQEKLGNGTGLLTMLRDLGTPAGSSFALAAFGATVGARTEAALIEQAKAAGLGVEWVPALKAAAAVHGKQVDPALGNALTEAGTSFSGLFSRATAEAMAVAQPVVGYSLMGIMALALVLVLLLPRRQKQHV
jgi:MFS family permease